MDELDYTATATYRPAGLATEGYPGGRAVTYGVDPLARVTSVSGLKSQTPASYVTAISYAAHGGQSSVALGNLQTETRTWDHRIQPATMARGSSFALTYAYCPGGAASCATNNGNPVSQTIGQAGNAQQTYTYDAVGRLASAAEGAGGSTWSRVYGHDQPGNTWVSSHSGASLDPFTPVADSNFNTIDNNNKNQLTIQGSEYDAVGHQKKIGGYTQTYDGEGRLVTSEINSITTVMSYDGEGHQIKKVTDAHTTLFVYGVDGGLIQEYDSRPPTESGVRYLAQDSLGSTRMVFDGVGNPVRCLDYLPYGEQIPQGLGAGRAGACWATGEDPKVKFTGKERDTETSLDYFGARYFSAAQDRFTTPDAPFADQHPEDPQSWNLYAYVRNNPLAMVDVTGKDALRITDKASGQVTVVIPVRFTGSGATPERIKQIVDRDNGLNTNGSTTGIQVVVTDKKINGVLNTLEISPGPNTTMCGDPGSCVDRLGGKKGYIDSSDTGKKDSGPHEILHFAGIQDQYVEGPKDANGNRTAVPAPGYDNSNIMTSRDGTNLKPDQVKEAESNKSTKQCTVENGKTKCH
ncbi:RHS repeat-associated core domain-containing protein [uncultured Paludibaculum sp.]|uniref:RHS repeat-associated core domain-containing protein n=1 Tax=uncultured Paludibaculum sp. TaxID=1765020 RepID=UPI002AAC2C9B|nr:RHS repeat-associated core domain-containing protein [uncultured Paludibaculum sp.]